MGQELCTGKHDRQTRPFCKKLRVGGGHRHGNRKFALIVCEKSLYEEQEPKGRMAVLPEGPRKIPLASCWVTEVTSPSLLAMSGAGWPRLAELCGLLLIAVFGETSVTVCIG